MLLDVPSVAGAVGVMTVKTIVSPGCLALIAVSTSSTRVTATPSTATI